MRLWIPSLHIEDLLILVYDASFVQAYRRKERVIVQ